MYTGTLIQDLLAAVEQAEQAVQQRHMADELHEIFAMPIPITDSDQVFMGAA